jgi:hypothetical protein
MTTRPHSGHPLWKKGESGNPAGRPKGLAKAAKLVQSVAAKIAHAKHPQAAEITERTKIEVSRYIEVILLQLAKDDPKTFLAYYAGKPLESVDVTTNTLPAIVEVKFANDEDSPATAPQEPA